MAVLHAGEWQRKSDTEVAADRRGDNDYHDCGCENLYQPGGDPHRAWQVGHDVAEYHITMYGEASAKIGGSR
jgi:hypothetical protein